MVAPRPLLLSRSNMMIRDMDHTGTGGMIVSTCKVFLGVRNHIACGHWDVRIPTQIVGGIRTIRYKVRRLLFLRNPMSCPLRVVDPVVASVTSWKFRDCALGVVGDKAHILRKERLILLVDARRNVRPPQECLRILGAVVEAHSKLEISLAWAKAQTVHSFHPHHGIMIATPYRYRSVRISLNSRFDRHKGRRPVMLRPVELHSARDPWTSKANQGRLDHVLAVEEVVAIHFVVTHM